MESTSSLNRAFQEQMILEEESPSEECMENLYQEMKELEEEIEFVDIQEQFIKEEQQNLKREMLRAKEELKRIQSVPLVIGQFIEMVDEIYGLVNTTSGTTYMVCLVLLPIGPL